MSLVIPIFLGDGEGGGGLLNFRGGGVVKKRESPDFRSAEVGISVKRTCDLPRIFDAYGHKLTSSRNRRKSSCCWLVV